MKSIWVSLWAEILKIRKSKVFWGSVIFFCFIPCILGLLMFVQKYPDLAAKLGMIGEKALMMRFGESNWTNYFTLINQFISAISLMGFGFITSWIFGREYSDHTLKDIIALPISRSSIVTSKLIAVIIWSIILSVIFLVLSIIVGNVVQITDWSNEIIFKSIKTYTITILLAITLCTPVAFFASYSRGIMLPIGFIILTLLLANFTGLVGLAPYFPWAIPGLYCTPHSAGVMTIGLTSFIILFSTSIICYIGTLLWWLYADHK